MDRQDENRGVQRSRFSLSQETITILTVGVSLASIILVTQGDMRAEVREDREKLRAEARADREKMSAEARVDREVFARQITRLVEQQGTLNGLVEGLRHPIESPQQ